MVMEKLEISGNFKNVISSHGNYSNTIFNTSWKFLVLFKISIQLEIVCEMKR